MTIEEIMKNLDDCFPEWREIDAAISAALAPQIAAAGGVENYVNLIAQNNFIQRSPGKSIFSRFDESGDDWNPDAPPQSLYFSAADIEEIERELRAERLRNLMTVIIPEYVRKHVAEDMKEIPAPGSAPLRPAGWIESDWKRGKYEKN